MSLTMFEFGPAALWEDLKFDMKHYRDVSRLALVADKSNKQWLAVLSHRNPSGPILVSAHRVGRP